MTRIDDEFVVIVMPRAPFLRQSIRKAFVKDVRDRRLLPLQYTVFQSEKRQSPSPRAIGFPVGNSCNRIGVETHGAETTPLDGQLLFFIR